MQKLTKGLPIGFALFSFVVFFGISPTLSLQVVPQTFDFGWCPSNAKISAEYKIKNDSELVLPVVDVLPSCGCTAPDFTPADLSSMEEMKVGLTFNTRGFDGRPFNKKSAIKTEMQDQEYTVWLKGHVLDPNAKVVPVGNGIAAFEKPGAAKTQKLAIKNNGKKPVKLKVVQAAADWADVKIPSKTIKAGGTANVVVSVNPPYSEPRNTSITLEAVENVTVHRLTLAIRTGPPPRPYRRLKAPTK